jgi:hypothetical protein
MSYISRPRRARILLVANFRPGGNAADWISSFEDMGYEIVPFRMRQYRTHGSRLTRSLSTRLNMGPAVNRLNDDLQKLAEDLDYDLAFVIKGVWVCPKTVDVLRRRARSGHVIHLSIDSLFTDNRSHLFFQSVPLYSSIFTDKRFERLDYRKAGAQEVNIFMQGYGRRFTEAAKVSTASTPTDVCFVGHSQAHYRERLASVATLGVNIGIWGPGWPEIARKGPPWMKNAVRGDGLWGREYPATMSAAKIGLGLLSKRIPEEATTRSLEIPATGALLLAERTPLHEELFIEGIEADFFDGDIELVDKVRYYLANEKVRVRVARAGQERAIKGGYDMHSRLRQIMLQVAERTGIAAPQ